MKPSHLEYALLLRSMNLSGCSLSTLQGE